MQERVEEAFRQLIDYHSGTSNKMPDVKKLQGKYRGLFRLQIGDYRAIFKVERNQPIILVIDIVPRGNAYRI